MARPRHVVSCVALVATLMAAAAAHAQPSGADVAAAQGLFDEGKRLMQAGKYEEGCPKLVESQRLDPAGGTLLAIALCHEAQGKTATAWAEFGVALGEARKDRRADREAAAAEHIKTLEPKLTRVRISVFGKQEGLEVRRDGARVGDAQLGTPLPIDPGDHTFEARAPAKKTWTKVIAIKGEGATIDVTIPPLEDEAAVTATPGAVLAGSQTPAPLPTPPPPEGEPGNNRGTHLTFAAIAGGVGLVATGVGIAFGASASSKWSDAEKECPKGLCTEKADQERGKDAGNAADLSTLFFVLGGVGLAGGLVLFLTAPSASGTSTALRVTPGGLSLGGTL
jgi:hypothetical protein